MAVCDGTTTTLTGLTTLTMPSVRVVSPVRVVAPKADREFAIRTHG